MVGSCKDAIMNMVFFSNLACIQWDKYLIPWLRKKKKKKRKKEVMLAYNSDSVHACVCVHCYR